MHEIDFDSLSTYDYDLPQELIAQTPVEPRDSSRLMVVHRASGEIEHAHFADLPSYMRSGDLMVANDTRVMRARAFGRKRGGGARVEIFFLREAAPGLWEALVRPGRKLPPGTEVDLGGGHTITIEARTDGGRLVRLPAGASADELLASCGVVPLPPYIKSELSDDERYQTIYGAADKSRSSAAPTAGLHFTDDLLRRLDAMGVRRAMVTLDVGPGTFMPVKDDDVRLHRMHSERCEVSAGTAREICDARRDGRRVVAVGTTSVRTLESFADDQGYVRDGSVDTSIFIRPPYRFKAVDVMITNFHLPKSTLLMLVCAFAGHDLIMRAYREAVATRYRFFSFGDAMMIVD